MWKAIISGVTILFLLVGGRSWSQTPKLRWTHLSGEQGLSNNTIETIFQDSRGFIWIGTRDGLNRYDGQQMTVYRNDPADPHSLSDSYIKCITEDQNHQLWIGTTNGLNRLDRSTDHFTRFKYNNINALLTDHKGRLWVASAGGGLNFLDPNDTIFHRYSQGPRVLC